MSSKSKRNDPSPGTDCITQQQWYLNRNCWPTHLWPEMAGPLDAGEAVIMPCVLCQDRGRRKHFVRIQKVGDRFIVNHGGGEDDEQCALDFIAGLNHMGWPADRPMEKGVLERGGAVIIPCGTCQMLGQVHMLTVHQVGDEFLVETTEESSR
jgi:hypothetical protein